MDKLLRIKSLLKERKLTYKQFAGLIDVTEQTVVNYFSKRTNIDINTIEKIAKVLDVKVSYFFEDEPIEALKTNYKVEVKNSEGKTFDKENIELQHEVELLKKDIERLQELLKVKDEMIEILKRVK